MNSRNPITRRTALKIGTCGLAGIASTGRSSTPPKRDSPAFYTERAFDPGKATDGYFDMMTTFGYPIPDVLRSDQFWTCDFLQADFAQLGMAGIFWVNASGTYGKSGTGGYTGDFKAEPFGYLGHEIFLLPGQALPEHCHRGGKEDYGPKMESWQVRYGTVDFFGEHAGSGDETLISDMSPARRPWGYGEDWFKSKYVATRSATSGQLYSLQDPESWHFQRAGAEGAIVTEYATYHNHVAFSKPDMAFDNTKA